MTVHNWYKVPVFWNDLYPFFPSNYLKTAALLPLFPSSYLNTAADSLKTFVHVRHATWDRIPQGNVIILLMPSLVQSLSIYLTVTVADTQYFIALAVLQSCDVVSSICIALICHTMKYTE